MIDGQLHVVAAFVITVFLSCLLKRQPGGLVAAVVLTVLIVIGKEAFDATYNVWRLTDEALLDDCIKDLCFDALGIAMGTTLTTLQGGNT